MKISYQGSEKYHQLRDYFNTYLEENDDSDYFFSITLFGREFVWFIDK